MPTAESTADSAVGATEAAVVLFEPGDPGVDAGVAVATVVAAVVVAATLVVVTAEIPAELFRSFPHAAAANASTVTTAAIRIVRL